MERRAVSMSIRHVAWALCVGVIVLLCGSPLHAQVDTGTVLGTVTDASGAPISGASVTLTNEGDVDAAVPRRVRLDATCAMADGANGFRLVAGTPLVLEGTGGRLRAQESRIIGWARCSEPKRQLDVAS